MPKKFALFFLFLLSILVFLSTIFLYRTNTVSNTGRFEDDPLRNIDTSVLEREPTKIHEIIENTIQNKQVQIKTLSNIEEGSSNDEKIFTKTPNEYDIENRNKYDIEEENSSYPQTHDGFYDEEIYKKQIEETTQNAPIALPSSKQNETKPIKCRNTVTGPHYITDSRGYTCSPEHVDPISQCCKIGTSSTRYSCHSCNLYGCCQIYEFCVSCCIDPSKRESLRKLYKEKENELLYKLVKTVFQFCSTRCRTSSKSVINENRYRTEYKHCYARHDPPDFETTNL